MQYIIHQGFTTWNATYWVGANALNAQGGIGGYCWSHSMERGFEMKRYVQDRTVIEDTESTIDLLQRKWTLWNHPARSGIQCDTILILARCSSSGEGGRTEGY